MNFDNIKIKLMPGVFVRGNGEFDLESALLYSGKIAGVCYNKEGYEALINEDKEKTAKRIYLTLNNGHHSVYDHIGVSLNLKNIPKILAMVLNNEKQYTTSEKSARYTPVVRNEDSIISLDEEKLYNKWMSIFKEEIKKQYGNVYDDKKIEKLAQENARYMVTVFMPTEMIYTTTLRQLNYVASWMNNFMQNTIADTEASIFDRKLSLCMIEFVDQLSKLNLFEDKLFTNDKNRSLSLFGIDLEDKKEYFDDIYATKYQASFAELAQAQRHRTIKYKMEIPNKTSFFIPPILNDKLANEWIDDLNSVKDVNPQATLLNIYETGTLDDFILKCKERLCGSAQLEIMKQTSSTLKKYYNELYLNNPDLAHHLFPYINGARCTFKDYTCPSPCHNKEAITLSRKI